MIVSQDDYIKPKAVKGIKEMFAEQLMKLTNDALAQDIEAQMTDNSMNIRLLEKYQSNTIKDIHYRYNMEENALQEQMDDLDVTSDEFAQLKEEMQNLKEMEDQEVAQVENETADKETPLQTENDYLETKLEAIRADNEALEEAIKQDIDKNFGYFQ